MELEVVSLHSVLGSIRNPKPARWLPILDGDLGWMAGRAVSSNYPKRHRSAREEQGKNPMFQRAREQPDSVPFTGYPAENAVK
jgi:hypothetical protein